MKSDRGYVVSSLVSQIAPMPAADKKKRVLMGIGIGVFLFGLSGWIMNGGVLPWETQNTLPTLDWTAWYQGLNKPWFTPPSWVFRPVWMLLYTFMGVTCVRLLFCKNSLGLLGLWSLKMGLNLLWPILFFQWRQPVWALVDLFLLVLCLMVFLVLSLRRQRVLFWLNMPYMLWSLFALTLNFCIVMMNPRLQHLALPGLNSAASRSLSEPVSQAISGSYC